MPEWPLTPEPSPNGGEGSCWEWILQGAPVMRYVFGPVPSRRLGRSLGIDPIPFKTCNWNCVYCQLGRTAPLTSERREYVSADAVIGELQAALGVLPPASVDWITFGGSGEPTLHASLGRMIRRASSLAGIPVAVLTNGSLLHRPDVREELLAADAVCPSLDAGSADLYRRITRPWPDLSFESLVEGLEQFRRVYVGRLWVEVMLIAGLNDTDEALQDIRRVLDQIAPDAVYVNVPVRPPAEAWIAPPDDRAIERARTVLGASALGCNASDSTGALPERDVAEAILGMIARHPMDEGEIASALSPRDPGEIGRAMDVLAAAGRARTVLRFGRRFWTTAAGRYGEC